MYKLYVFFIIFMIACPFKSNANDAFDKWVVDYKASLKNVISDEVIKKYLDNVEFSTKAIRFSKSQPELSLGFWEYQQRMINDYRIKKGKSFLKQNEQKLDEIEKKYHIQKEYLTALHALETDFGNTLGDLDLVSSLASLAFGFEREHRRPFFKAQLSTLLKIIEVKRIDETNLKGSWAGAFGYFQFMPITFAMFAKSANNNHQINLFEFDDAFNSAANYLRYIGLKDDEPCLIPVAIPDDFNWEYVKDDNYFSVNDWIKFGAFIASKDNDIDKELKASLVMPEGYKGPSFLTFNNFDVIKKWNKSDYYALSVCQLAEAFKGKHIADKRNFQSNKISHKNMIKIQKKLKEIGLYHDALDGIIGTNTRNALKKVQFEMGLPADGYPSFELLNAWEIEHE